MWLTQPAPRLKGDVPTLGAIPWGLFSSPMPRTRLFVSNLRRLWLPRSFAHAPGGRAGQPQCRGRSKVPQPLKPIIGDATLATTSGAWLTAAEPPMPWP